MGERADEKAFDAADAAMVVRSMGSATRRPRSRTTSSSPTPSSRSACASSTGPHFEPRFEGNEHYDPTALAGALGLDEETDLAAGTSSRR